MASAFNPSIVASALPHRPIAFQAPPTVSASAAPAGTFPTGTKIQVGKHNVIIDRYLSEGGFAHVYLVKLSHPIDGSDVAVLKRVAVPDKDALTSMRTEVETMKKLRGHRHIVTYIDSHASQLKGGGYEVFLLMEYCSGGGLIDFMNTRLQNRLTESEILKIFSDVAEGVACMHYLKPPLLHRDLKVENVLISASASSRRYKLCDFGSAAPPRPAATTATECRLIEEDVQKHTTLQYRSPEMIDVYQKQAIDEKSDIWALGVLLYKLCYYTTPFEEQGQLAILHASFKFPGYPAFSDRIKKLIASMLMEKPHLRPNIYQVVREVSLMRGTEVPIKDVRMLLALIYSGKPPSDLRKDQRLSPLPPSEPPTTSSPGIGVYHTPPMQQQQIIPDIVPMRRGRPASSSQPHHSIKPSLSPLRGISSDPFAALDSKPVPATDELSSRFPTLDQFALLHDSGSKFDFDEKSPTPTSAQPRKDLNQRVTETLADEAFARPVANVSTAPRVHQKPPSMSARPDDSSKDRTPTGWDPKPSYQPAVIHQPTPTRPIMISQGTMTTPTPPMEAKPKPELKSSDLSRLHSLPSDGLSSSQIRRQSIEIQKPQTASRLRPSYLELHRSQSQISNLPKSPASSRPSLEGNRPSSLELNSSIHRSKSANSRPRPSSAYIESNLDFLRDLDSPETVGSNLTQPHYAARRLSAAITGMSDSSQDANNITSNVDFLRAMEGEEPTRRKEKRSNSGSKHNKRASLPSISLSNTKNLLAGKFGDAFRRFEANTSVPPRTPSPLPDHGRKDLTPITGSEVTGERSDDGHIDDEDVAPETKRELERRRLAQEERRVEAAAAEYRKRLAERDLQNSEGGRGGASGLPVNRAATIQNKVKTLLDENNKTPVPKTAEGYGRFTDSERLPQTRRFESEAAGPFGSTIVKRKPVPTNQGRPIAHAASESMSDLYGKTRSTVSDQHGQPAAGPRPSAPPKPQKLRTGGQPPSSMGGRFSQSSSEPNMNGDEWEVNFSKRYPSLSGLEMVETEIDTARPIGLRSKEL
ncbi:hypothetical protein FGG08_006040 [Glutinoglossum americanum]|uniref:non-specific serine/threonine protein kinase n=1 Tax=Glutinoglossum americanum TaxID=1670608 RepID=A0A9P8HWX0_9PEZI|nr:hypothetical protein FGG08_006040 [Glutinoglossum americanum]